MCADFAQFMSGDPLFLMSNACVPHRVHYVPFAIQLYRFFKWLVTVSVIGRMRCAWPDLLGACVSAVPRDVHHVHCIRECQSHV
jgi:hypothetical protein